MPSWHHKAIWDGNFLYALHVTRSGSSVDSWDDRRLIAESLTGQTAAYGVLVRRYQDRLFNTVYRLLDSPEDAQDVVQESFISAYHSLGSFKGDSLFFTWLYRIAMNGAISLRRKERATASLGTGRQHGRHRDWPAGPVAGQSGRRCDGATGAGRAAPIGAAEAFGRTSNGDRAERH